MNIQLSDHFTYRRLIRFTISTVLMLICTSMYSIVDGLFVSNYVGKMPFAATNLIWPVSMGIAAIGFMLGTGGSAIVAKTLGEGKKEKANQYFSMILYFGIIVSVIFSVICFIFTPQIARMLKADGELLEHCIVYGRILFATQTAFILQNMFQSFLVAAEEPVLSLKINIAAGLTNVVFDYLFIAVFEWGVAGAAIATGMGQIVGGIAPFFFFAKGSRNGLRITWRTKLYKDILLKTCMNGSSEMVTNLSTSLVNILYNFQLMKLAGADGVAAFGVIMYVNFIFVAVFMGYSVGSAPIVSYHYGAGNDA
ncbi:MAG: MATE family efflux transporter, partial [[Ruminococcus] torques]